MRNTNSFVMGRYKFFSQFYESLIFFKYSPYLVIVWLYIF